MVGRYIDDEGENTKTYYNLSIDYVIPDYRFDGGQMMWKNLDRAVGDENENI